MNDTRTLRVQDLVQGVTSVCQLDGQEYFDFYPAVRWSPYFFNLINSFVLSKQVLKYLGLRKL